MPRTNRDRWLALALLLAVLAAVYGLLLQPLFIAPLHTVNAKITDLQQRDARLRGLLLQQAQVQQRVQALQTRGSSASFLAEPTAELATAALIQQLEGIVTESGGRGCAIVNRTPLENESQAGRYQKVIVQVRLRCGNAETVAVLHALESAQPFLFVDALGITAQRYFAIPGAQQVQEGGLDVSFNLFGYLRPSAGVRNGQ
ncbi:MAG: type II secretion system protein M [Thermomonas sp.]|uniref:type II secretion system protein GspM n=1 Tax=Thermomonas sp. TaxID=1971895 RepID=UPI001ED3E7DB|nr:type II secretion system protein GspM [Thermomonas sp.]MBV2209735.1 type II secretion system protein M [Thermomonas sp.]